VIPGEHDRQVFHERQHERRVIFPRVSTGNKNAIQPRASLVERFMLLECLLPPGRVRQVEVRRGPQPVVLVVALADFAHPDVHFLARDAHQHTGSFILKWDVLDAVAAEYRKLANVLIELSHIPGVP
jgi:hypothetical protein